MLDTGAASRGSGNANTNKEKDVRKWFVEQDLIEGVIYLPENLFYNTTAPGIILFLNKAKPKDRKGKLFLLNASREFTKGDPKNYLADDAILRIAETFKSWREEEKFSRIVTRNEIAKNDFNISPSRYIHTGEADEYRPIAEIVEELDDVGRRRIRITDAALKKILTTLARLMDTLNETEIGTIPRTGKTLDSDEVCESPQTAYPSTGRRGRSIASDHDISSGSILS